MLNFSVIKIALCSKLNVVKYTRIIRSCKKQSLYFTILYVGRVISI